MSRRAMTLDEWADLPEDVSGEWVDGALEGEEVPNGFHELAVAWLVARLVLKLESRGGAVLGSDHKYAVSQRSGRKPDIAVFLPGRHRPGRERITTVPPDIAVEIITPTPRAMPAATASPRPASTRASAFVGTGSSTPPYDRSRSSSSTHAPAATRRQRSPARASSRSPEFVV